jgi:hypothetical protein
LPLLELGKYVKQGKSTFEKEPGTYLEIRAPVVREVLGI